MDFFNVATKVGKNGVTEVYPNFLVKRSTDLMVKGRSFFAIWDEKARLWSTDEYDVQRLVDEELAARAEEINGEKIVKWMRFFDSDKWAQFRKYVGNVSDNAHALDEKLIFSNEDTRKEDYATKKLPYPLEKGDHSSWDKILHTLYSPQEADKIEWAIGAIVSGESKYIQKFMVLYGPSGTGKSTILNIIQMLFEGYIVMFDAKALGMSSNQFSTEVFKTNPLVAIQHDGDLSKIEDNTKLNSIVSHEEMLVNEKYKASYTARFNAFLFMGTNQPVKISDAKSGLIRRLIDVEPTGQKLSADEYNACMSKIKFELGAIAKHCLDKFNQMGAHYYDDYRPLEMMFKTDPILSFVSDYYDIFKSQPYTTSRQAYALYKEYCEESGIDRPVNRQKLQAELSNYFNEFHDRYRTEEGQARNVFVGFNINRYQPIKFDDEKANVISLDETESLLDKELAGMPAQLATKDGFPRYKWVDVITSLDDINTSELHYVKVPENHIVIDFDLKDESGEKSLERNIEAASQWPTTYSELSKSGKGVHLHYIYDGDVSLLDNKYDEDIEVKVYSGGASLRRKLSYCSNQPIAHINSGLPLKEKKVLSEKTIKSEKGLRDLIARNLRKEIHPGTKPSVDFIESILNEAYDSGMAYDVTDMRAAILAFASNSTNRSMECIRAVQRMRFKSEPADVRSDVPTEAQPAEKKLIFFDVEVYPNYFLVCWKYQGSDQIVVMKNPSPQDIETLFRGNLVGFNNRRYDNHILYGRYMGYDNQALYDLSQKIISGDRNAMFGEAYNLSYTDIYDFSSKKQSLKKFEIELGIDHIEMDIPWDAPVPEDKIPKVIEYCKNDVKATEAVFEARKDDFNARLILAALSGLTPNDTTNAHSTRIIFGNERKPQSEFVYTDLSEIFPGYEFDAGKSTYRGENPGEGGYVYAEPGIHRNVALLDVASMHPTSIEQLNLFGPYTKKFSELKQARIAIKHRDYDAARQMLGGKLAPYLKDDSNPKELSDALKIVINSVYGLTSAKFPNAFRDPRNKDNIVAKRGALFMIDLKHFVQEKGFTVAHIKTDSIKIPDATPEIIQEVLEFGKKYGYEFEHEATYDRLCLVNDAVYIAHDGSGWHATGAQFQHPVVFKELFTKEKLDFSDYAETRSVSQGSMYLDMHFNEPMATAKTGLRFIGKTGRFVPVTHDILPGGVLYRVKDDNYYAVAGTKGFIWNNYEIAKEHGIECIDMMYYEKLCSDARKAIDKFGDFNEFVNV